jgi:Tfp pilus assembly protein PilO
MLTLLQGDLKNQSNRCKQAQIGLGIALLVVTGAIFLFEVRPSMQRLEAVHKDYVKACWDLQQDQTQTGKLPEVEKDIKALQQRVKLFDKKLPRQHDVTPFMRDVAKIKQEAALKNLVYAPGNKPRRTDEFAECPYKFTFDGDFQSGLLEFLRRTEDMQQLTRIQKLDIKSNESHDGQVKVDLTMNIYFAEE